MGSKKLKKIVSEQNGLQQLVTRTRKRKVEPNFNENDPEDTNSTQSKQKCKKPKGKIENADITENESNNDVDHQTQTEKKSRKKLKQLQNAEEIDQQNSMKLEDIRVVDINVDSESNQSDKNKKSKKKTKQQQNDIETSLHGTEQIFENSMEQTDDNIITRPTEKRSKKKPKVIQSQTAEREPSIENNVENVLDIHNDKSVEKKSKKKSKLIPNQITNESELSTEKNVEPIEHILSSNPVKPVEKKSRKKMKPTQNSIGQQIIVQPELAVKSNIGSNDTLETEKTSRKKLKLHNDIEPESTSSTQLLIENIPENVSEESSKKEKTEIVWPAEDLRELINRMESCIPDGDHLSFKCRIGKLDWDKVTFREYSVGECQTVWNQLEKKVRGYRLLLEVLQDAKTVIESPPKGRERHVGMPKAPPSAYFLFSQKKKPKIASENPNLELSELSKLVMQTYKSLPPEKREKYEKLAAKHKEEHIQKLEQFFLEHPEIEPPVKLKRKIDKEIKAQIPKKPDGPFRLFLLSELKTQNISEADKAEFKDKCKEKWREMSDEEKLIWINSAEERYKIYEDNLKEYKMTHPDYVPQKNTKYVLNRNEVLIKDRLAGKPQKPPSSVYSLYTSIRMSNKELKQMAVKERLPYISGEWKNLIEEEKKKYKDMWENLTLEYKKQYDIYLSGLSEHEKQLELESNVSKKKRKVEESESSGKSDNKKPKITETIKTLPEEIPESVQPKALTTGNTKKAKIAMPKRPPTPFALFYQSEQQNRDPDIDKHDFKITCKEKWTQLPDKKKLAFITDAEERYKEYERAYKKFVYENPEFRNQKFNRPVLSKNEIRVIERVAGKPTGPPTSMYSFFVSVSLLSEEVKRIPSKERLSHISTMWKEMTDEEKSRYREIWMNKMEQYKKDFNAYLANLPEEKRQQELKNSRPVRRKKKAVRGKTVPTPKIKKAVTVNKRKTEKLEEPESPPISVFGYFSQCYKGERPASEAWKSLPAEERKKYHQELVQKKQEYIKEFERFLRSLTKEQLEEFSRQRMKSGAKKSEEQIDEDIDDDEDDDSDEDEESDEESEEENDDE